MQHDATLIKELIESAAEVAATRAVDKYRDAQALDSQRITVLETRVGLRNGNGLIKQVADLATVVNSHPITCEAAKVAGTANRWKWMAIGGYSTLVAAAMVLAALYKLHQVIK